MSSAAATADSDFDSDSGSSWSNLTLTTIFVSAATALVTGIPLDFISEFFIFPFYHNSTLGGEIVNFSSSMLLPFYESVGEFFGVASQYGSSLLGTPTMDLGF